MNHHPPPHCPRPRRWRSWAVPPFGLHRRIFWSLIAAMLFAGALAGLLAHMLRRSGGEPLGAVVAVGLGFWVTLWLASGRLARRLVAPLNRVVDAVQRFGQGDYSARAGFPAHGRDEVARVARAIDDMAERIERQVKEERQLLAVVSHELRTPMSRIRILTDLARAGHASSLDDIDREVAEVDYLVANILARSRLEFGNFSRTPVRFGEAVREAMTRSAIPADRLIDESNGEEDSVLADPTLLHRAISNLIDNAERHGHGVTAVRLSAANGTLAVEIADAGPGFIAPPGDRFAAFSTETGNGRGSGLGLGLNLVQRIVAAHGGRVWAENGSTGGARAGFELPVHHP